MQATDIAKLVKKYDWEKRWMERFTLYTASLVGDVYFLGCREQLGVSFAHVFFVYRDGMVTCYQLVSENTIFGNTLAKRLEENHSLAEVWSQEVRNRCDELLALVAKLDGALFASSNYTIFENAFRTLQPPFVRMTRVANYLTPALHDALLPPLNAARLATEIVYGQIDSFINRSLRDLAKQIARDPDLLELLYHQEVKAYVEKGALPSDVELKLRAPASGLYFENGRQLFFNSEQTALFERLVAEKQGPKDGIIRGVTSVPGLATGTVRIIFDPKKFAVFNTGDILVTNMTYPEFVPLMKKAGAIVTDGGGVLCHAAIVARELGKPCVTNTQVATNVLKDGDLIEVNATQGTVKKI